MCIFLDKVIYEDMEMDFYTLNGCFMSQIGTI